MKVGTYPTVMREIGGKMRKVIVCSEGVTTDEESEDRGKKNEGSNEEMGLPRTRSSRICSREHNERLRIDWGEGCGIL